MLFGKKLVSLIFGSGLIWGGSKLSSGYSTLYSDVLNHQDIEKIFGLTKNLNDVVISSSIDPLVSNVSKSKFAYSLFSTNLSTFSEEWNKHFYSWALYEWANWVLNNTPRGSFPGIKKSLSEAINKVTYRPNQGGSGTPFDSLHWTKQNNLITSAKEDIEKAFFEMFFKEVFSKSDNSDISKEDSELTNYGDLGYAKKMVDFQKFMYDDWVKNKRPVILCRKEWPYSSSFKDNAFRKGGSKFPNSPNKDFPDFSDSKDNIVEFNNKGSCDSSEIKVFTLSEVEKWDGREIDAFIVKYFSEINPDSDTSKRPSSQGTKSDDAISDIHKIFVDATAPNGAKITQFDEKVFAEKGTLKDDKDKHFLSFRDVKFGTDKKGTYIKANKGITFLYWNTEDNVTKTKEKLISGSLTGFKLVDELKKYFQEHPGEILGRYLANSELAGSGGIFGHKGWNSAVYEVAKYASLFTEELRRNKGNWKTTEKLSSVVKEYEKVSFGSNKKPDASAGLALPLWMGRDLDKSTTLIISEDSNDKFDNLDKNNGLFPWVTRYYGQDWKIGSLREYALELKKGIANYLELIREPLHGNKGNFFGDYVLDNVYHEFLIKDENKFIRKATIGLILVNTLEFDLYKHDLDRFVAKLVRDMNVSVSGGVEGGINKLILDSIKNIYYGEHYMGEGLEKRMSYGGFKFDKKKCTRKIVKDQQGNGSSKCGFIEEWIQKLENYWLMKNYVFEGDGYELGSDVTSGYLKFLQSIYQLSKGSFKELRNFVIQNIPAGRYGALVWLDRVDRVNGEIIKDKKVGKHEQTSGVDSIDSFDSYFRNPRIDEVFNPYFSNKIEVEQTKKRVLSSGHVGAYAKGDNGFIELFGFKGLYTEKLNIDNLSEGVKKSIFTMFSKSNKSNKNYAVDEQRASDVISGGSYGSILDYSDEEIGELIDSFKTLNALKDFLTKNFNDLSDLVLSNINNETSLAHIKASVKSQLNDDIRAKFAAVLNRFSGLIKNPNKDDSVHEDQGYLIPDDLDDSKKTGHIVYMTQVNKYDFGAGFSKFVQEIGGETFIKMIISLSMQEKTNDDMLHSYLISKGVII